MYHFHDHVKTNKARSGIIHKELMTEADECGIKSLELGSKGDQVGAVYWAIRGAQSLPEDGAPSKPSRQQESVGGGRVYGQLRISDKQAAKLFSKDRERSRRRKKKK